MNLNMIIKDVMAKLKRADHPRIILSGLAAGSAYLAEQPLDNWLLDYKHDDIQLQGEMFFANPYWRPLGVAQHYAFSLTLTYLYVLYGRDRLPGPEWLRALLFINAELALLTPLVLPLDKIHPAVRRGDIQPLGTAKGLLNQFMRHAAFGLALGLTWGALRKGK